MNGVRRAFVIEALTVGGAEQMLVAMANAFAQRGDTVHVICLTRAGELAERLDDAVTLHVLDKRPGADARLVPRLRQLVRRIDPVAVNAHLWVANLWTRVALAGSGRRIIVTEHSRDSWKSGLYRRIDRSLVPMTALLIAVSEDTAAFYRDEVRIPAACIRVINNGIDVARYAAGDGRQLREAWARPDQLLIGTVGRLIPAKNQLRFIDAVQQLIADGIDVRAVIVGEGPERPSLQAAIEAARLDDVVRLTGARSDVPDVLAAFDVFVLSSDREGHPLTALEAQAAGTPVVLSDAGGSRDAIAQHVDGRRGGLLVAPDAGALAGAIATLADATTRTSMARYAAEHAREHFGLSTMVDRYAEAMDSDG